MDNNTYSELYNLINKFNSNKDDLVFIKRIPYKLSEIRKMNFDQLISLLGVGPGMKLYRYCRINNNTIENIEKNQVYLSNPDRFDDTFDCKNDIDELMFHNIMMKLYLDTLGINYDSNIENKDLIVLLFNRLIKISNINTLVDWLDDNKINKVLALRIQHIYLSMNSKPRKPLYGIKKALDYDYKDFINNYKKFRITCFTNNPTNLKMWSLYANDNKGICIEYTLDENHSMYIFSVLYSHLRGDFKYCVNNNDTNDNEIFFKMLIESVLRKDISWIEQDEYRLISANNLNSNNIIPFHPITAIYAGDKISTRNLNVIKRICSKKGIDLYKMERDVKCFELYSKKVKF